nr:alpha/beta hydrolase [Solirubrobacterales bacterium]
PARDRACGELSRETLAHVEVAVARRTGEGCRPLDARGRLARGNVPCSEPRWLRARLLSGGRRYVLRTGRRLPTGRYRVRVRAIDRAGNVEPEAKQRRLTLRVR